MFKKSKVWFRYQIGILLLVLMIINLMSCRRQKELEYYSEKNNFISVTAEICYVKYDTENSVLYLAFSNLPEEFSDDHFKIIHKNLEIIKKNNGEKAFEIGNEITFITAPRYFGDGYIMPIISVSVGEEVLLEFEEGYKNFMEIYE